MPNAILDPTGSVKSATNGAATAAAPRARRPVSLNGARVGLLINTKQNARPFLEEVGRLLTEKYDVTLTERTKVNFAVPEPDEVIKHHGAEILRLWSASVDFNEDVRISQTIQTRPFAFRPASAPAIFSRWLV